MSTEILMPALSPTMTEGKIARWVKSEGDHVAPGDVLAEIETDKATMEVEAVDEGILAKIVIPEGTEHVAVNTPIAVITANGEKVERRTGKSAGAARDQAARPVPSRRFPRRRLANGAQPCRRPTPPPAPATPGRAAYSGATATITVREALRDAIAEEMRRDDTVFLIGEEVAEYQGAYKVSQGLLQEFGAAPGHRHADHRAGLCRVGIGAASPGLRPIVEFMTFNFAMQAIDQIINSAAKTRYMSGRPDGLPDRLPRPERHRLAGRRAALAMLCELVRACARVSRSSAPYTGADHKGLLKSAIRDPNPVVFPSTNWSTARAFPGARDPEFLVPIGKARIARRGEHVTITAFSRMVKLALQAAEELDKAGISAEVIDLRTLRPFDVDTVVASVKRTNNSHCRGRGGLAVRRHRRRTGRANHGNALTGSTRRSSG